MEKKIIAIFGAGVGLGASLAARFSREGYRVAIVARRAVQRVAELSDAGVEAVAFPADLTKLDNIGSLVRSIDLQLGSIDVAVYAPLPSDPGFVPAVALNAAKAQSLANLFTFSPIELCHTLLPGMLAGGDGAIVIVSGISAIRPMPGMSGPGPLMAAARNYVLGLNAEVMPRGVYTGSVSIGQSIERSESFAALIASGAHIDPNFAALNPDDIAEEIWTLVTERDRAEAIIPPLPSA
jgi:short-subunit dehydrogenase